MSSISEAEKAAAERQNLMNVISLVRRSENPNPVTLVLIIVAIVLVMWAVYIGFIKKSPAGVWYDAEDNKHTIMHDKWRGVILVDNQYSGAVNGHLVLLTKDDEVHTGLWLGNQIQWTDGSSWYCVYGK